MFGWNWAVENRDYLNNTIERCRNRKIFLPTFAQHKNPQTIPAGVLKRLKTIDIQETHPLNLFRIHWQNDITTGGVGPINYLEIPQELSGVKARIIGLIGKYFPTGAHKVGATYGCLTPYLVTGRFNPEFHKAVWPSTGNYCRGGVFNSNLLNVSSVAILPEEMSQERFNWLKERAGEVYATPGCESNVKEIYDKCHELSAQDDSYIIFNQFDQFGNCVWHYEVTGYAIEQVVRQVKSEKQDLSAFVSATGSAGTIAAGDYLRKIFPHVKVLASEALQCPTLLENGFGGHRIEGIGDKHVPWIHNVRNTDLVCAIDDDLPMRLLRLFNETEGHKYLAELGLAKTFIEKLPLLGISSISNLISCIKLSRYYEFNENDIIFTVFTDSAQLYQSRLKEMNEKSGKYSKEQANVDWHIGLKKVSIDYLLELTYLQKKRIHNLKYFTWIEQQGKTVEELNAQWRNEEYWQERFGIAPVWDKAIEEFNKATGLAEEYA
ncbi:MAG: pyridoxal-phosphate dependent enzyme [Calditrichaceae bacterium]|nr:pyridoxal-phosphate dependent enzyme [Calditrichaceae bacterium]MBN2710728.1 pyridoxal-phosphate dependent enzyme [Calditrichaceae bacterium]RQV92757.1 MAG: pyridoxal-phosphate dependent enzyme [Calditrichota bacterium]